MPDVKEILEQRGNTHGSFDDNASIVQDLRRVMRESPNWAYLSAVQQLALEEDALKTARILSSGADHNNPEHWKDKAGYAQLVVNHLEKRVA